MINAIIAGGTSGIGLGIANKFAAPGYNLLLNGLEKNGEQIARKLATEYGIRAEFSPANMQYPEQMLLPIDGGWSAQ